MPESKSTSIRDVPNEPILKILQHLSAKDRVALGSTCKRLYELSLNQQVWNDFEEFTRPYSIDLRRFSPRRIVPGFIRASCLTKFRANFIEMDSYLVASFLTFLRDLKFLSILTRLDRDISKTMSTWQFPKLEVFEISIDFPAVTSIIPETSAAKFLSIITKSLRADRVHPKISLKLLSYTWGHQYILPNGLKSFCNQIKPKHPFICELQMAPQWLNDLRVAIANDEFLQWQSLKQLTLDHIVGYWEIQDLSVLKQLTGLTHLTLSGFSIRQTNFVDDGMQSVDVPNLTIMFTFLHMFPYPSDIDIREGQLSIVQFLTKSSKLKNLYVKTPHNVILHECLCPTSKRIESTTIEESSLDKCTEEVLMNVFPKLKFIR